MKLKKITYLLLVAIIVIAPLAAKGNQEEIKKFDSTLSIIDSRDVTISLTEKPTKIVSLSPNITEILFALNLGDYVVGRTDYCDWPLEASFVDSMGDLFSPSIEKIVSLNPDIVIISNLGQSQTIEALELASIKVAFLDEAQNMEGTYQIIEKVAKITATEEKGAQIIAEIKNELAQVKASLGNAKIASVYYVAGFGEWGDYTATQETFINDIINLAGAENIAFDAYNWSFQKELIIERDPDVIILPPLVGSTFEQTVKEFSTQEPYNSLTAVKKNRFIAIDNSMMERQGPRSGQAVKQLSEKLKESMGK
jgi:iron complex transport system substrate-binding protein